MANRVVLCEDDDDLRDLVHELLEEQDFAVHDVVEIDDLIEECKRRSPCVALIDSTSPTEFDLWHLGPVLADLGVPAIAFTAHATAHKQFEADARGYIAVVSKPFDADEFVETVNSVCWAEQKQTVS